MCKYKQGDIVHISATGKVIYDIKKVYKDGTRTTIIEYCVHIGKHSVILPEELLIPEEECYDTREEVEEEDS